MKKSMHRIAMLAVRLASIAPSPARLGLAILFSGIGICHRRPAGERHDCHLYRRNLREWHPFHKNPACPRRLSGP